MKQNIRTFTMLSLTATLLLGGCLGAKRESQMAVALQVIMVKPIESYLFSGGSGVTVATSNCGADSSSGTISVTATTGTLDPSNSAITAAGYVTFTNCIINVCGTSVTLDGSKVTFSLAPSPTTGSNYDVVFAMAMNSSANPVTGAAIATPAGATITATGLISTTPAFSYRIQATGSGRVINSISVQDAVTATPHTDGGLSYDAATINALANGC